VVQDRPPCPVLLRDELEQVVNLGGVRRRRGAGEEVRAVVVDVVHKDAAHRVVDELQQRAAVHRGAPCLADAPRRREAPWRQAAEDVGEDVLVQRRRAPRLPPSWSTGVP
jgi:hypothetical protein